MTRFTAIFNALVNAPDAAVSATLTVLIAKLEDLEAAYTKAKAVYELVKKVYQNTKKAIAKAFGTGIRKPIYFSEIEILRDELGKPYLNAKKTIKKALLDLGISKTHVSLADENDYAIAFAILEI
ncbi:MAG: holo-ACP synthase [Proteobacteria bacterium]|nr:holo-ACP synthase [Pseudomonadota bacterium]